MIFSQLFRGHARSHRYFPKSPSMNPSLELKNVQRVPLEKATIDSQAVTAQGYSSLQEFADKSSIPTADVEPERRSIRISINGSNSCGSTGAFTGYTFNDVDSSFVRLSRAVAFAVTVPVAMAIPMSAAVAHKHTRSTLVGC